MLKLYQTIGDSDIWSMGLIYHLKRNICTLQTGTTTKRPNMGIYSKASFASWKNEANLSFSFDKASSVKVIRSWHAVCTYLFSHWLRAYR